MQKLVIVGDTTEAEIKPLLEGIQQWQAPTTAVPTKQRCQRLLRSRVFLIDQPGTQSLIIAGQLAPSGTTAKLI